MPPPTASPDLLGDCRALYLERLDSALRNCSVLPGGAVAAVVAGAGKSYDEMIALARRGSFAEHARGLTSSRLTLVDDDQLELSLRLDKFTARLFEATGNALWKSYLRFITLLGRPDLPRDDHPVGPQGIAAGLAAMFAAAGTGPLEPRLTLIDRLEERLLALLPALYEEINRFLHEAGVVAAQPAIVAADNPPATARPAAPAAGGEPLAALRQGLLARFASALSAGPAAENRPPAAVNREQLQFRLAEFERRATSQPDLADDAAPRLEALIPGLFADAPASAPPAQLGARELGVPPASPEGLLIDTVAILCDAIAGDRQRPQVLHSAIALLRVTLIKQALRDDDRLADLQSPCRRLIDLFGRAVLGLPLETPPDHPYAGRLLALAEGLRRDFDRQPEAAGRAIAGLEALLAGRQGELARHAESYQPVVDLRERDDQAHAAARQVLAKAQAADTAPAILGFLDEVWYRVLHQAWREFGAGSPQWQNHAALVGNLLWTFQPKHEAEERRILASRLPEVLRQLKAGMEYVALPGEEQARILDLCFSLQTRAMRPQATPAETPPAATATPAPPANRREMQLGNVRAGERTALCLDFRQPADGSPVRLACRPGDWLTLTVGGRPCVLWVSALAPAGQRALLANPDDEPPLLVHKAILENLLRSGEARHCGTESLFEAAASAAGGMLQRG